MVDPDYEKWLAQHGFADSQCVQVLEFRHAKWGSLWITDYGAPFSGVTEGAVSFTAETVAFTVDLPKSTSSTQQEMSVKLDALNGYVMSQIREMTDAEREEPIQLVWRVYLDTKPTAPALDSMDFWIIEIGGSRLVVEFRCSATVLPNVAAGIRYTIDRFPTLAFL